MLIANFCDKLILDNKVYIGYFFSRRRETDENLIINFMLTCLFCKKS